MSLDENPPSSCLDLKDNEPSLPDQVSSALRKEILQDDQPSAESLIIFRLVNGYLSPHVAAIDLLATIAEAQDVSKLLITITTEIASLGIDYPTLHPNLIALISAIYDLPSLTSQRSEFLSSLSSSLGDLTQANYGHLFEDKSPGLIRDHMIANALYARLLNVVGHVQVPQERIFGLDDALFILSGALENEATAHEDPNIDVPTAAMYMIHAGKVFFEESKKGYDHFLKPF